MNEINELIEKIFIELHGAYKFEQQLEKYVSAMQVFVIFNNSDADWELIYHLEKQSLLHDYLSVVRDIVFDFGNSNLETNLKKIDRVSKEIVEQITNIDKSKITKENQKSAERLREILNEWKKLWHLKTEIKNIKDQTIDLKKLVTKVNDESEKVSVFSKEIIQIKGESDKLIEDLKDKVGFLNQTTDERSNIQIKKLYTDIYDTEIKIANNYRNWALGIFAVISFMLIWKFFNFGFEFNNWGINVSIPTKKIEWKSALNILLLIGLSTPAWYLARESSSHRKVAYKAQMLGTELASFPLYVRELKDEDRLDLRKHLADRFFGQELFNDSKNAPSSDSSLEQIKLLTEANKVLAEALKAKKAVE